MGRVVIACYRPKPGCSEQLHALARTHHLRLYEQGLVTRRVPVLMLASDGTVLEVFEWKSARAVADAHTNPAVHAIWSDYQAVCEYVPVGALAEAAELFSAFAAPAELSAERSPLASIYNHVQVDGRIGTSGLVTADQLGAIAKAGYRHVINLLPDDNRHALAGEAETLAGLGLGYTHLPVDFAAPRVEDLEAFEAAMRATSADKVWVHCAANYRVSAFMSLHGLRGLGWSAERSAELQREVWTPDATWQAFIEAHTRRQG